MPASVEILNIPIGSILTSTIGGNDKEDKNDFDVLLIFSENVSLTQSGVSVGAGSSIVAFEGAKSVYKVTIRPPQTSGVVTVTVAANAVSQGNAKTSKDIRVTRFFPDVDAEAPTLLFNHGLSYSFWRRQGASGLGIACSPNRILISSRGDIAANSLRNYIDFFTYDGTHQSAETLTVDGGSVFGLSKIDFINGDLLYQHTRFTERGWGRLDLQTLDYYRETVSVGAIAHTRLGVARPGADSVIIQPYDFDADSVTHDVDLFLRGAADAAAHQNDLLYLYNDAGTSENFTGSNFAVLQITSEDEFKVVANLNIARISRAGSVFRDIAIFGNTLYLISSSGTPGGSTVTPGVYTLDIRKYRPLAKHTKTTIYPIFAEEGDTIDLTQFSPDAERIVFDIGYDKQLQLSINTSNKLSVGSGAQTCFVKLKAINRIDATETESFGFYLIVRRAAAPVWRDIDRLTMRANSSYDLFQLVPDAESIVFRSGRTRLTGSSLSNGVFRVGTVGGVAEFTARKGSLSGSHIAIAIDVVQGMGADSSEVSGYRVEIAGIDVTADVLAFPSVSETLDPVVINEYRVNEASITLRNEGGKYNSDLAGNFWETNGLNAGGFQNAVKIYLGHLDGSESLHFSGVVNESFVPIKGASFKMNCSDISSRLRKALVEAFGTLEKWDALRKQSDEVSYEGVYVPERSLVPIQVGTGIARSDRTDLDISRLELPSEGPAQENTGYVTPTEFRTAGGFLDDNPLLGFMTEHRSEDVRFLVRQLAINKEVYNTEIDIPGVSVDTPFLLNRGSIAFSVEPTRTTRLPVDWVHDSTNDRILILLSNPEGHISDQLVQYDLGSDAFRVLHTFGKDLAVHRIERRSGTNYYILTSGKIAQDRSASQVPRPNDSTGYAYDSLAEGSEIKIWHYSTSSGTLTEHVAEDDTYPPQLMIHYHAGFENSLYTDAFEGIRPDYRGPFKWQSNNLYYRYAKDVEFGVARVGTGGTTTKMIGQAGLAFQNHLNFAFDINSSGTLYFVYATGDAAESTVTIKRRTSGGTETTVLSETRGIGDFNELGFDFGAFLGAYEALFHNKNLYILAPIQKVDLGDDTRSVVNPDVNIAQRTAEKSGERNVTTSTNLNPSNLTLTPGEDIPLRIDFDGSVSGATQDDLTVYGGTIQSFSISSDMIDVTIRPDSKTHHKTIIVDLAEDAVDQGNEAWRITIDFGTQRSRTKAAGMVLYRVSTNAATPSLEVLDKWDFVTHSACSLTIHDGSVHFVEQPRSATAFKPINPDLGGFWTDEEQTETMGYNVLPESLGALKKISSSGEVEHLGNVWFTDRPFNVFPTRMLSIGGDLHLCAGYGNGDEVLRYNSLASAADNAVHIVYGKTLHYVVPRFSPNGRSVYAALADLAKSVNATLSFEKNVVMITDRRPYRAGTDGATGIGTGNLSFSNANKAFPSSGYLLIGKEILRYTGITGGAFTGIQRGVLGSEIANPANNTEILYLDTLIQTEKLGSPYKAITLQADVNRIFNIIRDSGGIAEVRDEDSIALYGERPYTLDLGLTRHEKAWIEEIFKSYLEELKDLQQIVNIQVRPDFSLRLGQIVPFFYGGLVSGMRIVSVRYEGRTTHIKGRTV